MKTFFAQPLITEKSMAKSNEGIYQFVIPTWATKREVAEFISKHFNVTVIGVTTATLRGESVTFKRRPGTRATYKKASLRLKKGDSIAEFSLPAETANQEAPSQEAKPAADTKTESKITVRSKGKKKGGE
jgi:large subunit ribosomal protein L23